MMRQPVRQLTRGTGAVLRFNLNSHVNCATKLKLVVHSINKCKAVFVSNSST